VGGGGHARTGIIVGIPQNREIDNIRRIMKCCAILNLLYEWCEIRTCASDCQIVIMYGGEGVDVMVFLNVIFAARKTNNIVYDRRLTIASLGLYYLYKVRHLHTRHDRIFLLVIYYYIVISCSTHVIISSLIIVIVRGHFGSRSNECISILLYYNVA